MEVYLNFVDKLLVDVRMMREVNKAGVIPTDKYI